MSESISMRLKKDCPLESLIAAESSLDLGRSSAAIGCHHQVEQGSDGALSCGWIKG